MIANTALPRSTRRNAILAGLTIPLLATTSTRAAQQATPVTTETWVQYAERETGPLTLDVYLPAPSDTLRPAVLVFHGGAWTYGLGGPQEIAPAAEALARAGFVAFIVRYRLTSDPAGVHQWPDQLDDAQEAVRWVRANAERYGIDQKKIAAYGHSAGGHLSSHLGTRETRADETPDLEGISSRVQAVISIASHYDLSIPYILEFDQERIYALLGGAPDEVPEVTADASPITWVDETSAPFLLFAGGADDMSPIIQTHSMTAALQEAGVDVATWEDASGDHFNVATWEATGAWTLAFLTAIFGR